MRESRTYGSVRGALSNGRPYRDLFAKPIIFVATVDGYRFAPPILRAEL
jgi:hypothetical protein